MKNKIIIGAALLFIVLLGIFFFAKKNDDTSKEKTIVVKEISADSATAWWYKSAVIYNVDAEKFKVADDDGIGDFKGLTGKLVILIRLASIPFGSHRFSPRPT